MKTTLPYPLDLTRIFESQFVLKIVLMLAVCAGTLAGCADSKYSYYCDMQLLHAEDETPLDHVVATASPTLLTPEKLKEYEAVPGHYNVTSKNGSLQVWFDAGHDWLGGLVMPMFKSPPCLQELFIYCWNTETLRWQATRVDLQPDQHGAITWTGSRPIRLGPVKIEHFPH